MTDGSSTRLKMRQAKPRIAVLGLLAVLVAACGSLAPKTATSATVTPTAATSALACHAQATNARPRDHATVGIRVSTVARGWVTATEAVARGQRAAGRASARGKRTLWFRVRDTAPGERVLVQVRVQRRGRKGACQASFQPRPAKGLAAQPGASPSASPSPSPSPSPASAPPPSPAPGPSCYPLSNEGTCYEPGEYCRDSDHGMTGVAGDGEKIICEDNDGWRWEPV
jgi:hypothetical protein